MAVTLCNIHGVLCSKIADVHGIEVHDVRTLKFVYFQKIFRFLLHTIRDVTKGARGHNSPDGESLRGAKSHNNVIRNFSKQYICLRKTQVRTWGAKLVYCPRRRLTSLRLSTSRLSSQNGETCLQKYLPISGKLSITNNLKQNAVDYRNHFTLEDNLKIKKKVCYFENKHNSSPPLKTLGVGERRVF